MEEDFEAYYSSAPAGEFATSVTVNNIQVGFLAFASGILVCVLTAFILVTNGANVGQAAGLFAAVGQQPKFYGLILPHGLLELSAIVVAGGAGLAIGWAIVDPGDRSRREALAEQGRRSAVIALGLMLAFIVAGTIEGFVTPSGLPTSMRVGIGVDRVRRLLDLRHRPRPPRRRRSATPAPSASTRSSRSNEPASRPRPGSRSRSRDPSDDRAGGAARTRRGRRGWWAVVRDDDTAWTVRADVESFDVADAACGDRPGIDADEKSFSSTSDLPPGTPAEGVYWRVEGRSHADAVADCLRENGAINIVVEERREPIEPKSFESTDP